MGYLGRAWMAASVAIVNGQADQGHLWKLGLKSIKGVGKKVDPRWVVGAIRSDVKQLMAREERSGQGGGDESVKQVMLLNSWV
uniref:Uncharacterized protein n=1 Tax=Kalanchoe fedtschenkoi TaxID=63787 RepID=A0A7N0T9L2_KALFE